MREEIYQLYQKCFPDISVLPSTFSERFENDECYLLTYQEKKRLLAFSLVEKNSILLLCVDPAFQGKGIGTKMLSKTEQVIRQNGYDTIQLGVGNRYLYPGVPTNLPNSSVSFFEHFGYNATKERVDMTMNLDEFTFSKLSLPIPEHPSFYSYATEQDWIELEGAIASVNPKWSHPLKNSTGRILIVKLQGKIAGFAQVKTGGKETIFSRAKELGYIDYVGVLPEYRKLGLGRRLVAYGTKELQRLKCEMAYIGSTELEKWYERIGYKTYLRFWMGHKKLL